MTDLTREVSRATLDQLVRGHSVCLDVSIGPAGPMLSCALRPRRQGAIEVALRATATDGWEARGREEAQGLDALFVRHWELACPPLFHTRPHFRLNLRAAHREIALDRAPLTPIRVAYDPEHAIHITPDGSRLSVELHGPDGVLEREDHPADLLPPVMRLRMFTLAIQTPRAGFTAARPRSRRARGIWI